MERQTRQKLAVMHALTGSGRSLSPAEIWGLAQQDVPRINLSTVYRQLRSLQDEGRVQRVELPGQAPRFEAQARHGSPGQAPARRSARALRRPGDQYEHERGHQHQHHGHHHHFHCLHCDQVFPIHACPGGMERMAPEGFEVQRHDLTLHGRCASCVTGAA